MIIELEEPFSSLYVKGYLRVSQDGRRRLDLYNSPADRTTIAYARYLLGVQRGYPLTDDEEADHIDEDGTNDDLGNLQVLSKSEHVKKSNLVKSRTMVRLECPVCGCVFEREKRQVKVASPKCSRRCNGLAVHWPRIGTDFYSVAP